MANTYTISDLAKEFDLTTRAIRFYEDMGLLQPERTGSAGRNRVYSARDRTRLRLTLRAKRLGLSLTEAKEIIDLYDSPRDTGVQLRKFLDVLVVHRKQLEEQMADLQANLEEVREHEEEARSRAAAAKKNSSPPWGAPSWRSQDATTSRAESGPFPCLLRGDVPHEHSRQPSRPELPTGRGHRRPARRRARLRTG